VKAQNIGRTIHATALVVSLAALALIQPAAAMEAPNTEAPEEIIVVGQQSLTQLKVEIELAQDRMFGLFNELNDDDRYDIHCFGETRTGTLIGERECKPVFLRNSMSQYGKAYLAGVQGMSAFVGEQGMANVVAMEPQAAINHGYPILQEKMTALVEQNPEFAESVAKHHELIEEYDQRTSSARK
jgi:hypothetical protein